MIQQLHAGQKKLYANRGKYNVVSFGRRFGKTNMLATLAATRMLMGQRMGIFAPQYRQLKEPFDLIMDALYECKPKKNKTDGIIYLPFTGGRAEFWTLQNDMAGRGRKYHTILIDEAAFAPKNMQEIWERAIRPTLLDYNGSAWIFSTPKGANPDSWFYQIYHGTNTKEAGLWKTHHATSYDNPTLLPGTIDEFKRTTHPDVFRQEYLAEFVDWRGQSFFKQENLLENGEPVENELHPEYIYAVIDSAMKSGSSHDGTAIVFFARYPSGKLVVFDYDKVQVDSDLLLNWMPNQLDKLNEWAKLLQPYRGVSGLFIEDKGSGTVLLQHGCRHGMNVTAINSRLTSHGKDDRAMDISGHVYGNRVKIAKSAYNKVIEFKNEVRNHLLSEVLSFTIGSVEKNRADDLFDCFCYGIHIAFDGGEKL